MLSARHPVTTHLVGPLTTDQLGLRFSFSLGWISQETRIVLGRSVAAVVMAAVVMIAATADLHQTHAHGSNSPDAHRVGSNREQAHPHNREIDHPHRNDTNGHHAHRDDADTNHAHRDDPDRYGAERCNPDSQTFGLAAAVS